MPTKAFMDFTGGEAGDLGPDGCKPNQFQGRNVMVYQDGSVGPRPGTKALTATNTVVGMVTAFKGLSATGTNGVVYVQGKNVLGFTFSPLSSVSIIGTITVTATTTNQLTQVGRQHGELAVYGDKIYDITGSVSPLGSSPAVQTVAPYGIRLMAAGTIANPNRVYYSGVSGASSDITSWPALNFFDVGLGAPTWSIAYLDETRQRLSIANDGGEWWALTGVPGVNDTLRRQPRSDVAPLKWYHCARLGEGIWFVPLGEDFPVNYTGSVVDKLRFKYLRYTAGSGGDHVVAALPVSEALFIFEVGGSNYGLMRVNDAWTYHTFGNRTRFASAVSIGGAGADYDAPLLLCNGGGDAESVNFRTFQPSLDRPGKTGDTYAQPGDNSTTPLTAHLYSSYLWSKQEHDLRVKSITVEFYTWNTGSASTNHFDLTCRSVFRFAPPGEIVSYKDSKTYEFDELASATPADKTDHRVRFTGFDNQPGHAMQWRIDNLRGCAIRAVIVDYDEVPRR